MCIFRRITDEFSQKIRECAIKVPVVKFERPEHSPSCITRWREGWIELCLTLLYASSTYPQLLGSGMGDPPGSDRQRSKMGHVFIVDLFMLGQVDLQKLA